MVCSYCHEGGHNIRTCVKFDVDKIATMIAEGEAKQEVYRALDGAAGVGWAFELVDRVYHALRDFDKLGSKTVNERKRAILGLILNAES